MATQEKSQIQPKGELDAFGQRAAKAGGKLMVAEARRDAKLRDQRAEVLAGMWDKVDLLDMSKEGNGAQQLTALLLESAETEKPPMIFTKPSKVARDPVDVAFGDKDFSGKNIVAVADNADITQQDVQQLQGVFPDGLTIVGRNSNMSVNYGDYESFLGVNDAVVVLHEAQTQEQAQLQEQPQAQDVLKA